MTYRLLVEAGNDALGSLFALKDKLGNHYRGGLEQPTARDEAAHGGHGTLNVGRGGAGREVLRHDDVRPRQAADGDALVEGATGGAGIGAAPGRQPRPYQSLRDLGGASLLPRAGCRTRTVAAGDAIRQGEGLRAAAAEGRGGRRVYSVQVVRPFAIDVSGGGLLDVQRGALEEERSRAIRSASLFTLSSLLAQRMQATEDGRRTRTRTRRSRSALRRGRSYEPS